MLEAVYSGKADRAGTSDPSSASSPDTDSLTKAEALPDASHETNQPAPGLSHRQRDRPVRRSPADPARDQTASQGGPSQASGPHTKPELQASGQKPSVSPLPRDAARQPRASLQPLSAMQQTPYASPQSQAPVRHADFAENQQGTKAMATVQFWLTFHAEFGQKLRVVGSHKNLGVLHIISCMERLLATLLQFTKCS